MTPEEREKRLEEIREGVIRSAFTPIDDVYFLLKELDRVTAERDEHKDSAEAWERLCNDRTRQRDAAIARAEGT